MKNPQAEKKDGTFITLVGGNNAKRIGGNSYVIEAQNEGKSSRVLSLHSPMLVNILTELTLKPEILKKLKSRLMPLLLRMCMKTMSAL